MAEKPTILSKETLVPIGVLSVVIGGTIWITSLYGLAQQNARSIAALEASVQRVQIESSNFSSEISSINAKLDFLIEKTK